jgi:NAD(P)-dependent dehydrogenase (short-subunit alcohol dehydrogenase family)
VIGYRRGLDLDGSVVAVTGAASGIGRATALALADRGARPVLLGPPGDALLEAAAECVARGAAALPLTVDVTDADVVAGAARQAVERFGRLDGWVAVPDEPAVTPVGPLQAVPSADLRRQWAVTVLGAVHGAGAALPYMTAQRRGCWWSSPRWSGRSPGPTPPSTACPPLLCGRWPVPCDRNCASAGCAGSR